MNTTLDVRTFMVACDQEVSDNIYEKNSEINTRLYLRLILEEVSELLMSVSPEVQHHFIKSAFDLLVPICNNGDRQLTVIEKVNMADDLADINYVVHGLANAIGINLEVVKEEVQRSNMSKLDPLTGRALRDENNKVIKGPGYFKPQIYKVLEHESFT